MELKQVIRLKEEEKEDIKAKSEELRAHIEELRQEQTLLE